MLTVLVAGGSRGIGTAITKKLVDGGYHVIVLHNGKTAEVLAS
jgi:NAD(P)-dependent dehydrogenase (short-subunit alcohol dehydrogenase family)